MSPESQATRDWHVSVAPGYLPDSEDRAAAAARLPGRPRLGRMHLQVTTLIEASGRLSGGAGQQIRPAGPGGLDETLLFMKSQLEMGISMPSSQETLFLPSVDPRRGFRLY